MKPLAISIRCRLIYPVSVCLVVRKRRGGSKQADTSGTRKDTGRPVKTGSAQFVRELRSRTFPR